MTKNRHFCVAAVGRSTHAFFQYFHALQHDQLNPVERVVFSIALVNNQRANCPAPKHI